MAARDRAVTLQLLAWIRDGRRTYGDAMDAWRSTCPRLAVWEDALADGLVEVAAGPTQRDAEVKLTARGNAMLDAV